MLAQRHPVLEEKAARDRAEGKTEGRAEGKAEGRVEGKTEGRAEGKAEALISVLTERGVSIDLASRERILAESNQARLDHWIVRAIRCATVDELFADP